MPAPPIHRDDHLGVAVTGELDIQGRTSSPVGHLHAACFRGGQLLPENYFARPMQKITASQRYQPIAQDKK